MYAALAQSLCYVKSFLDRCIRNNTPALRLTLSDVDITGALTSRLMGDDSWLSNILLFPTIEALTLARQAGTFSGVTESLFEGGGGSSGRHRN